MGATGVPVTTTNLDYIKKKYATIITDLSWNDERINLILSDLVEFYGLGELLDRKDRKIIEIGILEEAIKDYSLYYDLSDNGVSLHRSQILSNLQRAYERAIMQYKNEIEEDLDWGDADVTTDY